MSAHSTSTKANAKKIVKKGPDELSADRSAKGLKFAIAVSRFNGEITMRLTEGALECLLMAGSDARNTQVFPCPGAFELPLLVQRLAQSNKFDAVIALGAVIRGGTIHFELISSAVANSLASVALQTGIPCSFGVITTNTIKQALKRSGHGSDNKGYEAARAAIDMVHVLREVPKAATKTRSR